MLQRLLGDAPTCSCRTSRPAPRPGWGLASTRLQAVNPRLIVCDISGYGTAGPYATRRPTTCWCRARPASCRSPARRRSRRRWASPSPTSPPACTPTAASWRRCWSAARTGKGSLHRRVDARGHSSSGWASRSTTPTTGRRHRRAAGAAHATIYPYGPFEAGDGKIVMMAVQNEREWRAFCERFLDRPELADHPDYAGNAQRNAHRDVLGAIIAARFSGAERNPGSRSAGSRASRARATSTRWPTCGRTRSSPPAGGGARWPPRRARYRRSPRPAWSARSLGWIRFPLSASTPA